METTVIYLDILIALNLFVTYFLLLSTAILLHQKPKRWRFILSAVLGGASSLLIFWDQNNWVIMVLIKIILGTILVWVGFGWRTRAVFIKTTILFITVNFLFAGIMMALWMCAPPINMFYRNGVTYFNISALTLAVSTIAAYFIVRGIGWIFDRRFIKSAVTSVMISLGGKEVFVDAFADTGNKLADPFSGIPVIICEYTVVSDLLPQSLQSYFSGKEDTPSLSKDWAKKLRVVPYHVVDNNGMLRCFIPDRFVMMTDKAAIDYRVLIGVTNKKLSGGEYHALLNATLTGQPV